jgi:hypothetical protein
LVFLFVCSFCFSLNSFLNLCSGVILWLMTNALHLLKHVYLHLNNGF